MKVLICGSRHFNDYELTRRVLDSIQCDTIIHGKARGADSLGERYAKENNIPCVGYAALWDQYGRRAGPIRNYQMLREGAPDCVVAFLAPNSRGTKHMIDIALKANIPVRIINIGGQT